MRFFFRNCVLMVGIFLTINLYVLASPNEDLKRDQLMERLLLVGAELYGWRILYDFYEAHRADFKIAADHADHVNKLDEAKRIFEQSATLKYKNLYAYAYASLELLRDEVLVFDRFLVDIKKTLEGLEYMEENWFFIKDAGTLDFLKRKKEEFQKFEDFKGNYLQFDQVYGRFFLLSPEELLNLLCPKRLLNARQWVKEKLKKIGEVEVAEENISLVRKAELEAYKCYRALKNEAVVGQERAVKAQTVADEARRAAQVAEAKADATGVEVRLARELALKEAVVAGKPAGSLALRQAAKVRAEEAQVVVSARLSDAEAAAIAEAQAGLRASIALEIAKREKEIASLVVQAVAAAEAGKVVEIKKISEAVDKALERVAHADLRLSEAITHVIQVRSKEARKVVNIKIKDFTKTARVFQEIPQDQGDRGPGIEEDVSTLEILRNTSAEETLDEEALTHQINLCAQCFTLKRLFSLFGLVLEDIDNVWDCEDLQNNLHDSQHFLDKNDRSFLSEKYDVAEGMLLQQVPLHPWLKLHVHIKALENLQQNLGEKYKSYIQEAINLNLKKIDEHKADFSGIFQAQIRFMLRHAIFKYLLDENAIKFKAEDSKIISMKTPSFRGSSLNPSPWHSTWTEYLKPGVISQEMIEEIFAHSARWEKYLPYPAICKKLHQLLHKVLDDMSRSKFEQSYIYMGRSSEDPIDPSCADYQPEGSAEFFKAELHKYLSQYRESSGSQALSARVLTSSPNGLGFDTSYFNDDGIHEENSNRAPNILSTQGNSVSLESSANKKMVGIGSVVVGGALMTGIGLTARLLRPAKKEVTRKELPEQKDDEVDVSQRTVVNISELSLV